MHRLILPLSLAVALCGCSAPDPVKTFDAVAEAQRDAWLASADHCLRAKVVKTDVRKTDSLSTPFVATALIQGVTSATYRHPDLGAERGYVTPCEVTHKFVLTFKSVDGCQWTLDSLTSEPTFYKMLGVLTQKVNHIAKSGPNTLPPSDWPNNVVFLNRWATMTEAEFYDQWPKLATN